MGLVVCSTALNNGGYRAEVGQVFTDTNQMVSSYPTFFQGYKNNIVTTGGVFATPIALTESNSGNTILVDAAAGLDFTLPAIAAAQIGTTFRFLVTTTISSNSFRVTAAAGDFLNGSLWIADFDTANTGAYFTANGSTHLVCTMNGSTTGGKKGTVVEFTAISATGWFVTGVQVFGDGVLATPFS